MQLIMCVLNYKLAGFAQITLFLRVKKSHAYFKVVFFELLVDFHLIANRYNKSEKYQLEKYIVHELRF